MRTTTALATIASAIALMALLPAAAKDQGHTGHGGHGGHGAMAAPADASEAEAGAIINSVDAQAGKINVTHEPVKALGWPKMTMDLPVTRRVDLTRLKKGDKVKITLKQGRDKQFRVIAITPQ